MAQICDNVIISNKGFFVKENELWRRVPTQKILEAFKCLTNYINSDVYQSDKKADKLKAEKEEAEAFEALDEAIYNLGQAQQRAHQALVNKEKCS